MAAANPDQEAKEIELKLAFDPADAPRILAHPILQAGTPETRELISIYYDTGDDVLRKAGVFLRVRSTGDGYVQTIKTAPSVADYFERGEWEQPIPNHEPDLGAAEGTALAPLLTAEVRAALHPRFHTRVRRRLWLIRRDGSVIELVVDQGEITAGVDATPISELELELKTGEKRVLFDLARDLAASAPLSFAVKSKAERGFELLDGGGEGFEKAGDVVVTPEMTVAEAFRTIGRSCLRQIVANAPGVRAGQAEAVHQMRVGLRRLRAAISLFADAVFGQACGEIKDELRWITGELGPARDLDVFAADVLEPLRTAHPDDAELAAAHRDFLARHEAAYAHAMDAVGSDRFRRTVLDLAAWIETGDWAARESAAARPVAKYAARELSRLRRKIKKAGARLRDLPAAKRHKVRISAKRLRYGTEFFAATFLGKKSDKRREKSLAALQDLQDHLGILNDIATRRAMLESGEEQALPPLPPADIDEEDKQLKEAEQAYARFAKVKAFWKA